MIDQVPQRKYLLQFAGKSTERSSSRSDIDAVNDNTFANVRLYIRGLVVHLVASAQGIISMTLP